MTDFRPIPNHLARAFLVAFGLSLGLTSGCTQSRTVLDAHGTSDGGTIGTPKKTNKSDAGSAASNGSDPDGNGSSSGSNSGSGAGYASLDSICGSHARCQTLNNVDQVDLLFVVDNSNSMKEEQVRLRTQFGALISSLMKGEDSDGAKFTPASLHLGVVSSDMGLPGVDKVERCANLGDDGNLLHSPTSDPMVQGCVSAYPEFLSADPGDNIAQTATDLQCIATLGTDGCGFEQQLEAGLKALWPAVDPGAINGMNRITFLTDPRVQSDNAMGDGIMHAAGVADAGLPDAAASFGDDVQNPPIPATGGGLGHGDTENAGFLRSGDGSPDRSLLAVVVLSDEDDGSSSSVEHNIPKQFIDPNDARYNEPLNLRNFYHMDELYPVTRYIDGLKALRPADENLVVFGAIVGAPANLVDASHTKDVGTNPMVREAFYETLLDDPNMQEMVDPASMMVPGQGNLLPSCTTNDADGMPNGKALPPRRIVQVAQGFGSAGFVASLCTDDFSSARDQLVDRIGARLGSGCLDEGFTREANGVVAGCKVLWDLPPDDSQHSADTPTKCGQEGWEFLLDRKQKTDRGGALCEVAQLAVKTAKDGTKSPVSTPTNGVMFPQGWYYDDFSTEADLCTRSQRRIAFMGQKAATWPAGVRVILDCK